MSVVQIPQTKRIWVCECGCGSFVARADGEMECCNCAGVAGWNGGKWFDRLVEQTETTEVGPDIFTQGHDGVFIERRMKQRAAEESVSWLVFGSDDGAVSAWRREKDLSPERIDWLDDRVAIGKRLLME